MMKMMYRTLFALLLIGNLLICPLRCLSSESESEMDTAGRAAPSCSCCHRSSEKESAGDNQGLPSEDCSCRNCFCEGATLQAGPVLPEPDDLVEKWLCPDCLSLGPRVLRIGPESYFEELATGSPHGRCALVALQMWLL